MQNQMPRTSSFDSSSIIHNDTVKIDYLAKNEDSLWLQRKKKQQVKLENLEISKQEQNEIIEFFDKANNSPTNSQQFYSRKSTQRKRSLSIELSSCNELHRIDSKQNFNLQAKHSIIEIGPETKNTSTNSFNKKSFAISPKNLPPNMISTKDVLEVHETMSLHYQEDCK